MDEGEVGRLAALAVDGGTVDPVRRQPALDPARSAGDAFAALLRARGVEVAGPVEDARPGSPGREIAAISSPPLAEIVGEMLATSDNFTAEMLLRETAVASGVAAGATSRRGAVIARRSLHRAGVPVGGLDQRDGSGLSRTNRVRCATLLAILEHSGTARYRPIHDGLAVAGRTGTLIDRRFGFGSGPVLRAKSGTLDGVTGLVGLFDGGRRPVFAFLATGGFDTDGGHALQVEVAHLAASAAEPDPRAESLPGP